MPEPASTAVQPCSLSASAAEALALASEPRSAVPAGGNCSHEGHTRLQLAHASDQPYVSEALSADQPHCSHPLPAESSTPSTTSGTPVCAASDRSSWQPWAVMHRMPSELAEADGTPIQGRPAAHDSAGPARSWPASAWATAAPDHDNPLYGQEQTPRLGPPSARGYRYFDDLTPSSVRASADSLPAVSLSADNVSALPLPQPPVRSQSWDPAIELRPHSSQLPPSGCVRSQQSGLEQQQRTAQVAAQLQTMHTHDGGCKPLMSAHIPLDGAGSQLQVRLSLSAESSAVSAPHAMHASLHGLDSSQSPVPLQHSSQARLPKSHTAAASEADASGSHTMDEDHAAGGLHVPRLHASASLESVSFDAGVEHAANLADVQEQPISSSQGDGSSRRQSALERLKRSTNQRLTVSR